MKTTKPTTTPTLTLLRTTANPQRTTLVEAAEPGTVQQHPQQPERVVVLPARTANPRRTVLLTAPGTPAAQEAGEGEPAAR